MIERFMYRGYSTDKNLCVNDDVRAENISAARFGDMVFLYYESQCNESPENILKCKMKKFPDGRSWERMNDIFHYSKPLSVSHWQRKVKKTPVFTINFLKNERVSEYIFYHFQYQEEYPGDCDKYGMIFNIENLIIMYTEEPEEAETENIHGMLSTKNTPYEYEKWKPLTDGMFKTWEDGFVGWKRIERIL
jgi:hypothetical protein